MSYQVLARKWRPQTFKQVVGQTHVLRALVNALDSDRLHHAYLFTGTRGVGKTSLARVFAKSLNCEQGVSSEPCGDCASCHEVDEGRFVDLIEVDAASRTKVDETRELLDNVQYSPTRGRYKVYLIDEVHMFSTHSFNALLKTLEEPPPHVKFLLATTDPKKLPVTILSRCLQFNLKRVPVEQLITHLAMIAEQESVTADGEALAQLAKAADGSVRDALSLLDQAIAYGAGSVSNVDVSSMLGTIAGNEIVGLVDALHAKDGTAVLRLARQLSESAPDYQYVLGEMLSFLRRIAVAQALNNDIDEFEQSPDVVRLASAIPPEDTQLYYQIALIGRRDLSLAPEPQAGFEMVLLRMLAFQLGAAEQSRAAAVDKQPAVNPKPLNSAPKQGLAEPNQHQASLPEPHLAASVKPDSNPHKHDPVAEAPPPEAETPAAAPEQNAPREKATGEEESTQHRKISIAQDGELDWHALVDELRLDGMVRELARNANVSNYAGKLLELVVEPQHENLKAERLVNGLEQALAEQADLAVQIKVVVADGDKVDTVAKRLSEQERQRQLQAEAIIAEDPTVQTLQNEFGATIESVSPR
ncbi:MAG: DNA polymerase III subunit gamma/tau [Gammaproteobacteria bacterium]